MLEELAFLDDEDGTAALEDELLSLEEEHDAKSEDEEVLFSSLEEHCSTPEDEDNSVVAQDELEGSVAGSLLPPPPSSPEQEKVNAMASARAAVDRERMQYALAIEKLVLILNLLWFVV
ncbi:hypothetical protein R83H12_02051 [Fibrobacteria bacterium R8-3-H12]